jgi:hypothetical protein
MQLLIIKDPSKRDMNKKFNHRKRFFETKEICGKFERFQHYKQMLCELQVIRMTKNNF